MALPETVRIKLYTEAADALTLTPVIARNMPLAELFDLIVTLTGKQRDRIGDLIERGTIVLGGSRFRWQGWRANPADIEEMLKRYPDPDPTRVFDRGLCFKAILRAPSEPFERLRSIEIPKKTAMRQGLLNRSSFWGVLLSLAETTTPAYVEYCYRERADRYRVPLAPDQRAVLAKATKLIPYSTLAAQISRTPIEAVELLTTR